MISNRLLRVIRLSLLASFRWWHLIISCLLFFFIAWAGIGQALSVPAHIQASINVWDGFFVSLAGPAVQDNSLFRLLIWFLPHLVFLYFIGDQANSELLQRGYYVLPIIGSRLQWWGSKIATLLIMALGYTLVGLIVILVVSITRLPWTTGGSYIQNSSNLLPTEASMGAAELSIWVFALLGSTLIMMGCLQTIIAIFTRSSFYGFTTIIILAFLSWLLGINNPWIIPWLPGSQSMLLRHTVFNPAVPEFSLASSLLYNTIVSAVGIGLGTWHIKRVDIMGPLDTR